MPAKNPLTTEKLVKYLTKQNGTEINADHVREAAAHFGLK